MREGHLRRKRETRRSLRRDWRRKSCLAGADWLRQMNLSHATTNLDDPRRGEHRGGWERAIRAPLDRDQVYRIPNTAWRRESQMRS